MQPCGLAAFRPTQLGLMVTFRYNIIVILFYVTVFVCLFCSFVFICCFFCLLCLYFVFFVSFFSGLGYSTLSATYLSAHRLARDHEWV